MDARPRAIATLALISVLCGSAPAAVAHHRRHHRPTIRFFIATAYSVEGVGASGKWSHPGTIAADRNILPLNSKIRVYGAGGYSGEYTVEDTGSAVDGHHIDVFMPSTAEAKKFGRQRVRVVVLAFGDDKPKPPNPVQKAEAKAANREVRAEIAANANATQ